MGSVGSRLTLIFVFLTAVILAVFSGSQYLWVRDRHGRLLEKELEVQARLFVGRFLEEQEETRLGVHPELAPLLEDFVAAGGVEAEVTAADGATVFVSKGYFREAPGFRRREERVQTQAGEKVTVRLALSEEPLRLALSQLTFYYALFIPIVLILSWFLGLLFVRRALSPIGRIRHQAERISRANVSERVPEPVESGEFRELARTFNEMLDRLDRAFQDLQNFAADAAHELRTPLATLRAEIETAVQQPRSPEEHERMLGSLAEEVSRMNRIVSDLFTLAKIDMRQYALLKERVELKALLEEAREVWKECAEENGVEILCEGPPVVVAGDPVALRRVFMNLIDNAIKYNRPGGSVTLSTEPAEGKVRVRVRDTGMGMAPEDLPRLFKRFYRVDKARSRDSGGAGLGLAICKSFVEAHEGTISAASVNGEGTEFTIELPLGEPARLPVTGLPA